MNGYGDFIILQFADPKYAPFRPGLSVMSVSQSITKLILRVPRNAASPGDSYRLVEKHPFPQKKGTIKPLPYKQEYRHGEHHVG